VSKVHIVIEVDDKVVVDRTIEDAAEATVNVHTDHQERPTYDAWKHYEVTGGSMDVQWIYSPARPVD
jgi:hypothetical protein